MDGIDTETVWTTTASAAASIADECGKKTRTNATILNYLNHNRL